MCMCLWLQLPSRHVPPPPSNRPPPARPAPRRRALPDLAAAYRRRPPEASVSTWFTSDSHLGHGNIIRYCNRPFSSVDEMDEALIKAWNTVVAPEDDVWHLGDFAVRNAESAAGYRRRLNGRIHLVWGNHDSEQVRQAPWWASSQAMAEITVDSVRIVLCHYAMRVWNRSRRGSLHLFGHSHGTLPGDRQSVDVGVDYPAWRYRPVSLREIRRHLQTLPERGLAS